MDWCWCNCWWWWNRYKLWYGRHIYSRNLYNNILCYRCCRKYRNCYKNSNGCTRQYSTCNHFIRWGYRNYWIRFYLLRCWCNCWWWWNRYKLWYGRHIYSRNLYNNILCYRCCRKYRNCYKNSKRCWYNCPCNHFIRWGYRNYWIRFYLLRCWCNG